ncbi:tryptophan-rich sensory protein [Patescibacteria group bacterium]|nr:tryptophan-rich sensory protein [Patescibacteria group bacterium]
MRKRSGVAHLLGAVLLSEAAGIIGSFFTVSAIPGWYATLHKPWFSPPNWVFGPVWTTLYALMGVALFLVWERGMTKSRVMGATYLFLLQLALNALWSILFFGLRNPGLAFWELVILWGSIVLTIRAFYRIRKSAAYFLVPYLLWVSFAGVLNWAIWSLNSAF